MIDPDLGSALADRLYPRGVAACQPFDSFDHEPGRLRVKTIKPVASRDRSRKFVSANHGAARS
jgi:hypothetical protein